MSGNVGTSMETVVGAMGIYWDGMWELDDLYDTSFCWTVLDSGPHLDMVWACLDILQVLVDPRIKLAYTET